MELSERLLKFLDLDKPDDDPDFQDFLTEFKISAKRADKHTQQYDSRRLGFSLTYNRSLGIMEGLCFHIFTAAVADGAFKPYEGLLPFGITTSDTRDEVRSKLGVDPIRSTPYEGYPDKKTCNSCEDYPTWWDTYNLPTLTIGVIFRSPVGGMDLFAVNPAEKRFVEKIAEFERANSRIRKEQSDPHQQPNNNNQGTRTNSQATRRNQRRRPGSRHQGQSET